MSGIYVGSKLRVILTALDVDEAEAETPMAGDIGTMTLVVWKPDGTVLSPALTLTVTSTPAARGYIDFGAGVLNQVGTWKAQGFADGFKSTPVEWTVRRNP